jgi:hypothetical protein
MIGGRPRPRVIIHVMCRVDDRMRLHRPALSC